MIELQLKPKKKIINDFSNQGKIEKQSQTWNIDPLKHTKIIASNNTPQTVLNTYLFEFILLPMWQYIIYVHQVLL